MNSDPSGQPRPRTGRAALRAVALIVGLMVLVGLVFIWLSRGPIVPDSPSPSATQSASQSSSIAGPTAVPTLDFFRGRSYPTPTPQPIP